ncbi:12269_t:CDS:2, partial [Funneliformis mosseae]
PKSKKVMSKKKLKKLPNRIFTLKQKTFNYYKKDSKEAKVEKSDVKKETKKATK